MTNSKERLDALDKAIIRELQKDCRIQLQDIADRVGANASSTVYYRIKRLERDGIIDGYYAHINPDSVQLDYITVILVRAKYGPKYYKKIGQLIAKIPGVWAVYFTLGEWDFTVLTRSRDRAEYMKILDNIMELKGIERSSTMIVAERILEDPRLQI